MATRPPSSAAAGAAARKRAPRRSGRAATPEVRVRMYDVGFGDAFLVFVPCDDGVRKILIDCGSVEASPAGGPMRDIVRRIVDDATDPATGQAEIDVVIATHRHKDHVSGFGDPAWDDVHVREVWLPWTEHPTDPGAREIRELQTRLALGLQAALAAAPPGADAAAQRALVVQREVAANALMLANDKAMKTLHGGFAGSPRRRFLPVDDSAASRSVEPACLPGVRVHVLGPSRDPEVIRDLKPPKGESYLRMRAARARAGDAAAAPFEGPFAPEFIAPAAPFALSDDDRRAIDAAGSLSELAVAVSLDQAVNGTSLMLMLEVRGTLLLFPGDAQWGSWMEVMADPQWREMLQRVAFYKIGHHASHNATPKTFVRDLLPTGCCAMASTLTRTIWPDIPRKPLLQALVDKGAQVVRSDAPPARSGGAFRVDPGIVEARIPV